jgi:hypothetical protein
MVEPLEGRLLLSVLVHLNTVTVTGTHDDDEIALLSRGDEIVVHVNGQRSRFSGWAVERIEVLGRQGNDRIDARRLVRMPELSTVKLHGGAGDDRLESARIAGGPSRLYGGAGNDRLRAWGGRFAALSGQGGDDLIVGLMAGPVFGYGGRGADRVYGGTGDDILYAGQPGIKDDGAADFLDAGPGQDTLVFDSIADVRLGMERTRSWLKRVDPEPRATMISVGPSGNRTGWAATLTIRNPGRTWFITFGEVERDGNQLRVPVRVFATDGTGRQHPPPLAATVGLGELPPGLYTVIAVGRKGQTLASEALMVS